MVSGIRLTCEVESEKGHINNLNLSKSSEHFHLNKFSSSSGFRLRDALACTHTQNTRTQNNKNKIFSIRKRAKAKIIKNCFPELQRSNSVVVFLGETLHKELMFQSLRREVDLFDVSMLKGNYFNLS